jgi:ureidoglycolate hydrolase
VTAAQPDGPVSCGPDLPGIGLVPRGIRRRAIGLDDGLLQVTSHDGPGYRPLVEHGAWLVALMNRDDGHAPETVSFLERHNETDEVFALLGGRCILYIGDSPGDEAPGAIHARDMEAGKLYNVRRGVWHNCALGADAKVLVVENADTSRANSDYVKLSDAERAEVVRLAEELWKTPAL